MKSVCVYCGSSDLVQEKYLELARQMGKALAERNLRLIYGGGSTGLMGTVADGALAAKGEAIGVIPEQFNNAKLAHNGLTRLEVVNDMHQRKARMIELADAFIALPGGFGTMEELFEALTWAQIGIHKKAIGLLNAFGYFDNLLGFLEHASQEGFTFHEHQGLYRHADSPETLLKELEAYETPKGLERWLERD